MSNTHWQAVPAPNRKLQPIPPHLTEQHLHGYTTCLPATQLSNNRRGSSGYIRLLQ